MRGVLPRGYGGSAKEVGQMSARRGWIGEPQPPREWHESIYSRMARYFENERRARTTPDDYNIDTTTT